MQWFYSFLLPCAVEKVPDSVGTSLPNFKSVRPTVIDTLKGPDFYIIYCMP
jgi:hypothetical protein